MCLCECAFVSVRQRASPSCVCVGVSSQLRTAAQPIEAQMLAERYLDGIQLIALPGIVCRIQVVVLQLSKAHHLQVRMQPP